MGTYVITGAASGIGAALATVLVADGHQVHAWDRHEPAVDGARGTIVDLTDLASVREATDGLPDVVDGLANVAGVPGSLHPRTVLAVNVFGTRSVTQAVHPRIRSGGAVVTIASIAARRSPLDDAQVAELLTSTPEEAVQALGLDGPSAYDASKKAIVQWAAALSTELLGAGVRSVTVSPGPVATPILEDFAQTMGDSVRKSEALLQRHARPREVAEVAAFLLSRRASWVNGIDIPVDGGLLAAAAGRRTASAVAS